MNLQIEVTQADIDAADIGESWSHNPIALAMKRYLHTTSSVSPVYIMWLRPEDGRVMFKRTPHDVSNRLTIYFKTGDMMPFEFEFETEEAYAHSHTDS